MRKKFSSCRSLIWSEKVTEFSKMTLPSISAPGRTGVLCSRNEVSRTG